MKLWSHARHDAVEQAILNQLNLLAATTRRRDGVPRSEVAAALHGHVPPQELDDAVERLLARGALFLTASGALRARSTPVGAARSIHAVDRIR